MENFLDGYKKREIIGKEINKGSILTNDERLDKLPNAVKDWCKELKI